MRHPMKQVLLRATLLLLSTVVCFAIFEFAISRFYYSDVQMVQDKEFDETLGWRLKPGAYLVKPPHAFAKHEIFINRYGMRSREIAEAPEPGTERIVILGDSFAFGKAVPPRL